MLLSAFLLWPALSLGQSEKTVPLTFEQALKQLGETSYAQKAAEARLDSKRDTAESLEALDYPSASIDAEQYKYQKSLSGGQVRFDSLSVNNDPRPTSSLNGTPYDAVISQSGLRSAVNASWRLYTGGRITAQQKEAQAMSDQALAGLKGVRELQTLELVQLYFGQRLAGQVVQLRLDLLEGMRKHLDDAIKLEKGGLLTRAQRLQAQVAFDTAKRAHEDAVHKYDKARIALSNLLRVEGTVDTLTPLFVLSDDLEAQEAYLAAAQDLNPQLAELAAIREAVQQKVQIERARWKPDIFLFGQYNLNRGDETPIDPDWIGGIGARWQIYGGPDRNKSINAARNELLEVDNTALQTRINIDTRARQAFDAVENARRQYDLLQSSLDSARENLRVQEVSFREGQNTSTDVTDARTALNNVLVEMASVAYQFDVELAQLLHASGQMDLFVAYLNRKDKVQP